MRHVRMLGLCLIAALGVAAITAAGASALPEFGKCETSATHEGKYTDSNCTKKAKLVGGKGTGAFEWHNSLHFTKNEKEFSNGTGEKVASFLISTFILCTPSDEKLPKCREGETETKGAPLRIECEEIFDIGEFSSTSSKEVKNIRVKFVGCKGLGATCTNTSTSGTIETNVLKGTLGYIKKAAPKEVGVDIKPQSGKEFAQFECGGGATFTVGEATSAEGPAYPPSGGGDGVLGVATPINEMSSVLTQAFTANEETAENVPSKLEGKPIQVLEDWFQLGATSASKWSPAGETVTVHNACRNCTGEEGVGEIKA